MNSKVFERTNRSRAYNPQKIKNSAQVVSNYSQYEMPSIHMKPKYYTRDIKSVSRNHQTQYNTFRGFDRSLKIPDLKENNKKRRMKINSMLKQGNKFGFRNRGFQSTKSPSPAVPKKQKLMKTLILKQRKIDHFGTHIKRDKRIKILKKVQEKSTKRVTHMVIRIQSHFRGYFARKLYQKLRNEKNRKIVFMQHQWKEKRKNRAAKVIMKFLRGYQDWMKHRINITTIRTNCYFKDLRSQVERQSVRTIEWAYWRYKKNVQKIEKRIKDQLDEIERQQKHTMFCTRVSKRKKGSKKESISRYSVKSGVENSIQEGEETNDMKKLHQSETISENFAAFQPVPKPSMLGNNNATAAFLTNIASMVKKKKSKEESQKVRNRYKMTKILGKAKKSFMNQSISAVQNKLMSKIRRKSITPNNRRSNKKHNDSRDKTDSRRLDQVPRRGRKRTKSKNCEESIDSNLKCSNPSPRVKNSKSGDASIEHIRFRDPADNSEIVISKRKDSAESKAISPAMNVSPTANNSGKRLNIIFEKENNKENLARVKSHEYQNNESGSTKKRKGQSQRNILFSSKELSKGSSLNRNPQNKRSIKVNGSAFFSKILSPTNENDEHPEINVIQSFKSPENLNIPSITVNEEDTLKYEDNPSRQTVLHQKEEKNAPQERQIKARIPLKKKPSEKPHDSPQKLNKGPPRKNKPNPQREKEKVIDKDKKTNDSKYKDLMKNTGPLKSLMKATSKRVKNKAARKRGSSMSSQELENKQDKDFTPLIEERKIEHPKSKFKVAKEDSSKVSGINISINSTNMNQLNDSHADEGEYSEDFSG
ncbi:unnamed protein product [Moneuplotes crassus]|uniref:Uncharacterized protein n=1 Tax=Euplotes crassus TaxID=5936 RepID=A0AAD1UKY1_EUPCR|nr:unnamed protein product [Moneuplotes crassus]